MTGWTPMVSAFPALAPKAHKNIVRVNMFHPISSSRLLRCLGYKQIPGSDQVIDSVTYALGEPWVPKHQRGELTQGRVLNIIALTSITIRAHFYHFTTKSFFPHTLIL